MEKTSKNSKRKVQSTEEATRNVPKKHVTNAFEDIHEYVTFSKPTEPMTLKIYQKQAERTLNNACMTNLRMGIVGETGEIVDYVKKVLFHGHELDRNRLIEELGDLLWYVVSILTQLQVEIGETCKVEWVRLPAIENATLRLHELTSGFVSLVTDDPPISLIINRAAGITTTINTMAKHASSDIEEVMRFNINKLLKRYPDGFDKERSIKRG